MKNYVILYAALLLLCSACDSPVPATKIINQQASVPASFGVAQLGIITSLVNKRQHTMSTLYGNSVSLKRARSGSAIDPEEKLVLVTWQQKPDEKWFGANIPGSIISIEQVETGTTVAQIKYIHYIGETLTADRDTTGQNHRINTIFALQASVMP